MKLNKFMTDVVPLLRAQSKDIDELRTKIGAFLKQGEEEEVPVVNEDGSPVEVEQIVLVGAPADPAAEETPPEEEEPAELTERAIQGIVEKAVAKVTQIKQSKRPALGVLLDEKPWAKARTHKSKVFTGEHGDYKAYAFGQFLAYATFGNQKAKAWLDKEGIAVTKAQSEGVNSEGGSLVPQEFSTDIIRLVEEFGSARQLARVMPMTRDQMWIPRTVSEGAATWVGEGSSVTEADDVYDNVELVAKKLGRITRVSRELMEDAAISVADIVGQSMAQKFAEAEDDAYFNGTGTSAFGGAHGLTEKLKDGNHTAGLIAATSGDDSFAEILIGDLHKVIGTLPTYALGSAQWVISQVGFANCFQRLTQAAGGTTRMETEGGARLMFEGYPVHINQKMYNSVDALGAEVAILFGDFSLASTLGDRQQLEISTSEHVYWTTDQIGIRGIERISIVNHDLGDTSTAGPVVGLQFTT